MDLFVALRIDRNEKLVAELAAGELFYCYFNSSIN